MSQVVVTQLIVDASGAQKGVADFEAAMDKAKKAANENGVATSSAFERAQQKWQQSLAATDPIIRAQIQMQQALARQQAINTEAVKLGIATQEAAAAQLQRVNDKYQGYVDKAEQSTNSTKGLSGAIGSLSNSFGLVTRLAGAFGIALSVGAVVNFGKEVFNTAANLDEQAQQVGVSTEALLAYRAALQQNGIETSQTDQLLQKLTRSIGEAQLATGAQRTAFVQLGLSAQDLAGGPNSVIPKVATGLLEIQDASQRAQIETDLFGKSGQRLESALRTLADPTADLIEKEKALGQVMGTDLTKAADDAQDRMSAAWNKLQVSLAGPTVAIAGFLTSIINKLNTLSNFSGWDRIKIGFELLAGLPFALNANDQLDASSKPTSSPSLFNAKSLAGAFSPSSAPSSQFASFGFPSPLPSSQGVFDPAAWSKYLADRSEEARLTKLSASEQAAEKEAIAQSIEKQTINGIAAKDINKTYSAAVGILSAQELSHARSNGMLIQQSKNADKIKETFGGYLDELKQAADVSKLSASEKQIEANVIKAAVIDEKAHGIAARDTSKTYADAVKWLRDGNAERVRALTISTQINALVNGLDSQKAILLAGLGASPENRDLAMEYARDAQQVGAALDDATKAHIAENAQIQKELDLLNAIQGPLVDYIKAKAAIAALQSRGKISSAQGKLALSQTGLYKSTESAIGSAANDNIFGAATEIGQGFDLKAIKNNATQYENTIADAERAGIISAQTAASVRVAIEQNAYDKMLDATTKYEDAKLALGQNTFDQLSQGLGDMFGKQSAAYKVAFGVEKAFQIARATLALETSIAQAAAAPWPTNIPAIAAAIADMGQILSAIASISPKGFATGVIGLNGPGTGTSDSIPAWLSAGESVITAAATSKNPATLAAINAGASFDRMRPANSNVRIEVVHDGSTAIRYERVSEDHIRVIANQEAYQVVQDKAPDVVAASQRNPNGKMAKAVRDTVNAKRERL
jgi:hypothetical protein